MVQKSAPQSFLSPGLLHRKGGAVPELGEFWGEAPVSRVCPSTVCSALHHHPQLGPKGALSLSGHKGNIDSGKGNQA